MTQAIDSGNATAGMSERSLRICFATASDAAAVLETLQAAFEPYRSSYTPRAYEDTTLTLPAFIARLKSMSVLLAVTDGSQVAGTLSFQVISPREGHLRGMAVLPGWQGSGAANKLLAYAERELRRVGCDRVSLDTTAPLQRAVRFYERHGYRFTGRVTDFFGMPLYEYTKVLTATK